ncbi:thiol reductant ABC exporter subunit CydC [Paractinoplanes toevensis]|uniref:Glutathione/cysteine ABC transporter permease/ATPase n=1 Tax=Paractinoplanes toevensis TaxID=571911 RepID=A0A919W5R4_9ACTN|nr:thiol reductant ABC exporter subunit CydC [Actinoplanes toevensis]GIM93365.1 glutathione/cysteine ABC transporter permease/ATPase [Actinoplanes toevensis]
MTGRPANDRGPARVARGPVDPRLLRHARSSRAGVAALALLGAGQAAATIAIAVALTLIIAEQRGWAVALLTGAYAVRAALSWTEQVVAVRTAARVTDELRRSLLTALPRRGPAWVARFGAGRLTTVLTSGLDSLRPWFSGYLPSVILGVTLPLLVIVVMALVDPASALIALLTLPLIPVLGALIGWATEARARARWQADARLAGHFLDVVRGLPTLRVFGRATRQTGTIATLTDQHRTATLRVLRVAFLSSTALDLVGTLSVGLIAVEAGLRVAAGHLPLAPALLVILLAPEAYRPLREMAARYHAATDATAAITDMDEVLRAPTTPPPPTAALHSPPTPPPRAADDGATPTLPAAVSGEGLRTAPASPISARAAGARSVVSSGAVPPRPVGVSVSGLRARYTGAASDALVLPDLTVSAGEIVALSGPSGSGKTTALRVLAGLHEARTGAVVAGETRYLPQRPTLPHARTVADLFPGGAARAALSKVGLTGELTPETPLGDHGTGVSAGQRHRLALAVLLHQAATTPATLLLDEPTAHLDPETEHRVITQLRAAAEAGSAILVVAHRPALLAAADRVIPLAPPESAAHAPAVRRSAPLPSLAPRPRTEDPGPRRAPDTSRRPAVARLSENFRPRATTRDLVELSSAADPNSTRSQREHSGPATSSAASPHGLAKPPPTPTWTAVVALGGGSSLAGLLLTGAAAWLLVRAATLPPVLTLSAAVVLVRGSAVARPLLRYLERLLAHDIAFAHLGSRRAAVYTALIPRTPGPNLRRRGDLLDRVAADVDARVDGLLRGRLPAASAAVTLAVAVTAAVATAPSPALPLLAGLVIAAVLAPALAARQAAREDAATATARARLRDAMVETVDGLEELPTGSPVPAERSRALSTLESRAARSSGRATALAHLGWGVAVAGTAWSLAGVALPAEWTAVLLLVVVALGETVLTLPEAAIARRREAGATARLAALTATPVPAAFPPDGPAGSAPVIGGLSVRGLAAGWAADRAPVLRDFDLDLPAGAHVAVTGRSGSGKSTLGAVLARLLDPRDGTIIAGNGRDLRTFPEAAVRGRIVLAGDDTGHIFASTVRENLRLARPAASDAELRVVLDRVRLGGWLDGLPDGLGTWLGTGGTTVSGGQARRLATARALLADPEVLILDEPTEGLDADLAESLMADLLDASAGRTVLLLTHRREGLDRVDRIIDLDDRRVPAVVS